MRLVPVIDLQGSQVVQAIAGQRAHYRPVQSVFAADAQPRTVARGLAERFGFSEVYVADLGAIAGLDPDWPALEAIAGTGLKLWLDAGAGTPVRVQRLAAAVAARLAGEARIVVGLESLVALPGVVSDPDVVSERGGRLRDEGPRGEVHAALAACRGVLGRERAVFSLDLRDGRPLTAIPAWQSLLPANFAAAAVAADFSRLIVLDLARVGGGQGTGLESLCRDLRACHPDLELIAGGGVRDAADLPRLEAAGCDAVLVATALHTGQITPADWVDRPFARDGARRTVTPARPRGGFAGE